MAESKTRSKGCPRQDRSSPEYLPRKFASGFTAPTPETRRWPSAGSAGGGGAGRHDLDRCRARQREIASDRIGLPQDLADACGLLAIDSPVDLQAAINRYLAEHNQAPKPFVWTAEPEAILAKIKRGHQTLETIH